MSEDNTDFLVIAIAICLIILYLYYIRAMPCGCHEDIQQLREPFDARSEYISRGKLYGRYSYDAILDTMNDDDLPYDPTKQGFIAAMRPELDRI